MATQPVHVAHHATAGSTHCILHTPGLYSDRLDNIARRSCSSRVAARESMSVPQTYKTRSETHTCVAQHHSEIIIRGRCAHGDYDAQTREKRGISWTQTRSPLAHSTRTLTLAQPSSCSAQHPALLLFANSAPRSPTFRKLRSPPKLQDTSLTVCNLAVAW